MVIGIYRNPLLFPLHANAGVPVVAGDVLDYSVHAYGHTDHQWQPLGDSSTPGGSKEQRLDNGAWQGAKVT